MQTKVILISALSFILVALLVLGGCVWYLSAKDKKEKEELNNNIPSVSENADNENDIPDNDVYEEEKEVNINLDVINAFIKDANGADISVAVTDLKTGKSYYTRNEDDAMPASALINIPVLYTAFKGVEDGELNMDSEIAFQYMFPGRGKISKDEDGQFYTLNELLTTMLRYSDNNATNSLLEWFSPYEIENACSKSGFHSVKIEKCVGETSSTRDNYVSAKDVAGMLYRIYNSKNAYINKDYLCEYMRIQDSASTLGMIGGVRKCTFLNHNAFTSSIYNECAIVITADSEYAIVFMSNNGNYQDSALVAENISGYVFNQMN